MLQLNAAQDPALNNEWVTGGVCQCGVTQTYGAYFVRSRETGAGPTIVELLWPSNGEWPPEVDFNETGGQDTSTTATNIWAASGNSKSQIQQYLTIDMTQWHTWGVIWTPTSIVLTVDGTEWGSFTSNIPDIAMWLDIQQQTWCSSGFACPTSPESTDVDWVAEYTAGDSSSPPPSGSSPTPPPTTSGSSPPPSSPPAPTGTPAPAVTPTPTTTTTTETPHPVAGLATLSSFTSNSATLSPTLKTKIAHLAARIIRNDDNAITLTGYGSNSVALAIAWARVRRVESYLRRQLILIGDPRVVVIRARTVISQGATITARLKSESVVALLR
jgi:outer membrane protein OmpA-like peptidoglycan-associated protein